MFSDRGKKYVSSPYRPGQSRGLCSLLCNGYQGLFPQRFLSEVKATEGNAEFMNGCNYVFLHIMTSWRAQERYVS